MLYIVQMKRFTASQARQHLAAALDAVEHGEPVIIERRGLRFVITTERLPAKQSKKRKSQLDFVDPALDSGNWRWTWQAEGGLALSTDPT